MNITSHHGKIIKGLTQFTVSCGNLCGLSEIDYHQSAADYERRLKLEGWKKIKKQWHCPSCAAKVKPP